MSKTCTAMDCNSKFQTMNKVIHQASSLGVKIVAVLLLVVTYLPAAISAIEASAPENITLTATDLLSLPAANRESLVEKISDKVYDELKAIAFSPKQSLNIRWKALIALGQSKKPASKSDLLTASQDPTWFMRNAALIALSAYQKQEVVDVAKKLIKDKSLVVRSAAVEAMKPFRSLDQVRDSLWAELDQEYNFSSNKKSLWVRAQIVEVLSLNPSTSEKKKFEKLIQDHDLRVAFSSTFALEKLTGQIIGSKETNPLKRINQWKLALKKNYTEID